MTYVEVNYRYTRPLSRAEMERIGELPSHYGIRRIQLDETNRMARIEFDASRLKESEVLHWLRRAGIPLGGKVKTKDRVA